MISKPSGCSGCVLEQLGSGFMQATGSGRNGVLLCGESLGKEEAAAGVPFIGAAGNVLDKLLDRARLKRDDFKIANTVWCRPPDNKLAGQYYMAGAIEHCAQYLDGVISDFKPKCIVALGGIAAKRLLPDLSVGITEAAGYCFWSTRYNCWILPTVHPSFIMRGKTAWAQVLIHSLQRAVIIAAEGLEVPKVDYTLDCTPEEAHRWVDEFEAYAQENPDCYLSTDIETPQKDADEEDLNLEDGSDYVILRCGYSFKRGSALSIPWDGPYRYVHERLLSHGCHKLFWNGSYDIPRLLSQGVVINGACHDGMDAWHVLNSDLKKSLGFVTPFFYHGFPMWKHTSSEQPAWYNAADADTAGVNMRGTVELLKQHGIWGVYNEYICELDPVYSAMTRAGMPVDLFKRVTSSKALIERRNAIRAKIEEIVPQEIKTLSPKAGYVREPENKTGLVQVVIDGVRVTYCSGCGVSSPTKQHFKSRKGKLCSRCGSKYTKSHVKVTKKVENPCAGAEPQEWEYNDCVGAFPVEKLEGLQRWAKVVPFVPSPANILKFQKLKKHPFIFVGKGAEKRPTTDEKAIKKLIGKHHDPFYELVLDDREYTKVGGTYIGWWNEQASHIEGGFPIGRDSRVHGIFRHTPSTLRSSMVAPNLQNLPRGDDSEVQRWVKAIFVAPFGYTFRARDFSGIEAQLVGIHANSKDFLRLAKLDIHSYFTAHNLYRMGILPASDLPSLSWSDEDLRRFGKEVVKARFKVERDIGKRCIHAGDYRVGPRKLHEEYPTWFKSVKEAAAVLKFFYEVFPEIDRWHERICLQVDKTSATRNSFGHIHRFYRVLDWEKRGGKWEWSYGDDAKRLIAFGPQSDAAFIGKNALKRLYYNYPDTMAKWLRLFIHDEIFAEVPKRQADYADELLKLEMEKPIPHIKLDPSWGFGEYLVVETEPKGGDSWDSMH